eukprot:scaffold918_cov126-Cylindrotheca_fusiformis.AAC.61
MPPALLSRLSTSIRQHQKHITCYSDSLRQDGDNETCAICWKNLPKKPQTLPCGHEFCKGCIVDLTNHAKSIKAIPSCPICRGPVEKESVKTLWKQVESHERAGKSLLGFGPVSPARSSSAEFSLAVLTSEATREYGLAVTKLEKCLALLDDEAKTMSSSKETAKLMQKKVTIMMKLQEMLKCISSSSTATTSTTSTGTHKERRIELLQNAMKMSSKPLPEAHMALGKIYRSDEDNLKLAMTEFQTILRMADLSVLNSGATEAKILRGKAHYNLALCYQRDGQMKQAATEFDLAHKFKSCRDYASAAKCHLASGNVSKAIYYGKKALRSTTKAPKCDNYLTMLSIYEKLFLKEQAEGKLSQTECTKKNYRYAGAMEHYSECLAQAKILASNIPQRGEVLARMATWRSLFPWKHESLRTEIILSSLDIGCGSSVGAASKDRLGDSQTDDSLDLPDTCIEDEEEEYDRHEDSCADSLELPQQEQDSKENGADMFEENDDLSITLEQATMTPVHV